MFLCESNNNIHISSCKIYTYEIVIAIEYFFQHVM